MARINKGDTDIVLEGIKTPLVDTDAANKAYVDAHPGTVLTAGDGIDITNDVISVADDGITSDKIATNAVGSDAIAQHAVTTFEIAPEAIDEVRLDATNTPTAGQILSAAGSDDQFTWVDQASETDYQNAAYGAIGPLAFNGFSYVADLPVTTEGGIAIDAPGDGLTGNILTFRIADVDLTLLQSFKIIQIGYGSPFATGTYAVVEASIASSNSDNIQITVADGPLDGTDVLASLPGVGDLMTIVISRAPIILALDNLTDVSETAPTNNQVLTYNTTDAVWEPADAQGGGGGESITASGGLQRIDDDISIEDDGITTAKIAPQAITTEEIADGTIVESDIAEGAISTNRLADSAVSSTKLADLSVATGKLQDVSVTRAKIADSAINAAKLNVDDNGTIGQVLSSDGDGSFTWADDAQGITNILNGGHIDVSIVDDVATLTFDETLDIWNKDDWVQINSGTPSLTDDEILWDTITETLTVPSVNGRTVENILLSARTGMGIQIRRQQTDISPPGFTSGFFQILSIDASLDPEQVVIQLLPDETDIFNEEGGGTFTYELVVLQFVTGGTLNNLTLNRLADVDVSTLPTDGQVLAFDTASGTYQPANNGSGGGASSLDDLSDVTIDSVANDQILRYNSTTSVFENVDLPAAEGLDLGDLDDVNTNGVADGFVIRYDGDNSNYRAHSVGDTNRLYGGIDVDMPADFTIPAATGNLAVAIGDSATASHDESSAIGFGATTAQVNEVRVGSGDTHTTVDPLVAGTEGADNQLASVRYVKDRISDASRVVNENTNGIQTTTRAAQPNPWGTYRIDPFQSDDTTFQIATQVTFFDADMPTYIFYPPMLQNIVNNMNGGGLTTGTIPDFFEEITDVQTPNNIGGIDGNDENALGWKYTGYQNATVWMNSPIQILTQWRWINHDVNNESIFPPNVTVKFQLVHIKPSGNNVYDIEDDSAVVIAETDNFTFYQPTRVAAGATVAHDVNLTFPSQTQSQGVVNVATNDMIALRYRISFKGNGFSYDNDTETGLSLDAYIQNTSEFTPMFGIEHVTVSDSLVIETATGDLLYTDHANDTSLLLVDNADGVLTVPAATLGLVAGSNITITGKTIAAAEGQVLMAGDGIDITDDMLSIDLLTSVNGSGLTFTNDELRVLDGDSITRTADGLEVNFRTETNNPLEISGTGDAAGLALNIDEDGPLQKTTNGLDVILETQGGLSIGSLTSGIEVLLPANSGLSTDATGLTLDADLDELNDVSTTAPTDNQVLTWNDTDSTWEPSDAQGGASTINDLTDVTITGTPTDGQILEYDADTSMWVNTTLSGNHSFTAGTGLAFNSDSTVLNLSANIFDFSRLAFDTGDVAPVVNSGSTRFIAIGANNVVGGASSISMGVAAQALQTNTIAIGAGARAEATVATAVGGGSRAMAADSSAYGRSASATGTRSTAIGDTSTASATESTAVGSESSATGTGSTALGSDTSTGGTNAVAVGFGATGTGDRAVAIGSEPDTSAAPLAIAIGERASVTATRGIAIGSSSNSASDSADRVQVTGLNGIAIGRAASSVAAQGMAIGDDTRSLAADATAIGPSAQVTSTGIGSTAIGHNATATIANSTVLGSGTGHRVFAGSNELASAVNQSGDANSISCSINNDFFNGGGFNPNSTNSEILRYTQVNDLAIGRLDYKIALNESSNFQEGDRWAISSTSGPMRDAFGYAVGTYGIAIGTFVIAGSAVNSAAMGDMWLRTGSTTTNVSILFRIRSVIGTAPTRDSYISAQFNIAKF